MIAFNRQAMIWVANGVTPLPETTIVPRRGMLVAFSVDWRTACICHDQACLDACWTTAIAFRIRQGNLYRRHLWN